VVKPFFQMSGFFLINTNTYYICRAATLRVTIKGCQLSFESTKLKPLPPCCSFCKLLFLKQVSTLTFLYERLGHFELDRISIPSSPSTSHGMEVAQGTFSN